MKKLFLTITVFFEITSFLSAQCITPLPYFEGFEAPPTVAPSIPSCTVMESVEPPQNFGILPWRTEQWAASAKSGSQYLVSGNDLSIYVNNLYFITPYFTLQTGRTYKVKYYCKSTTTVFNDAPRLSVFLGTSQTSAAMSRIVHGFFSTNFTNYQLGQDTFTVSVSGNYCLGFRMLTKSSAYPISEIPIYIDDISLEDMGAIVPVKMGPLKSITNNNQSQLVWQTFTEQNNKGFHIETSKDGQKFTTAGFITSLAPQGNSSLPISYAYNINLNNNIYYRLKQEDRNGSFAYSNIVKINAASDYPAVLFDQSNKKINTFSPQLQKVKFKVANTEGKILIQKTMTVPAGYSQPSIDFTGLPKGIYFLQSYFEKGNSPTPIKVIL